MAAMGLVSPTAKRTPAGHDPFSQTITPVHMTQPRDAAPVVSLPPPVTQPSEQSTSGGPAESSHQHASSASNKVTHSHTDQEKKRKASYKIPRYTRRNQSRSEPSTRS